MELKRILAIFDPTSKNELLIERILGVARHRGTSSVVAYCSAVSGSFSDDFDELADVVTHRYTLWLTEVTKPLVDAGIAVTVKVDFSADWRDAMRDTAATCDCDMIIKNSYSSKRSPSKKRAKSMDRTILRVAKVPVYLIRNNRTPGSNVMLAAIKMQGLDEAHESLNQRVIGLAKAAAENREDVIAVHAVATYEGSVNHIARNDLAKLVDVTHNEAHTYDMPPAEGIVACANEVDAQVVCLGYVERKGVLQRFLSTTVEEILETCPSDIVCIVHAE